MPILNVKVCAVPSNETAERIASTLTELTVEILGKKRELTAVAIDFIAPANWFIAGKTMAAQAQRTFYLDIKVTDGTNSKDEKALYVSQVFAAMEKSIGPLAPASYVVIQDVRADSWGYQGQTQEFRYIKGKSL